MARVSFDDANALATTNSSDGVEYLTLKNDGDEAIVRFMIDDISEFDIHTVHEVKVDNKYRVVECLRDPREPLDNCPLCKANVKIGQKFYIRMIQYIIGQDGSVTPAARVWERGLPYAKTLKTYLENYGPLSNIICKIVRHGKAGDMQTTYEIVPNLSPMIYKEEIYVKAPNLFEGFSVLGRMVMDKTAVDMDTYIRTGSFPANSNSQSGNEGVTPRTYNNAPTAMPPMNSQPAYSTPPQTAVPAYQQYSVDPSVNTAPAAAPQYSANPPFETAAPAYAPNPNPVAPPRNPWDNPTPATGFDRPRRY